MSEQFDVLIVPSSQTTVHTEQELKRIKEAIGNDLFFWQYELGKKND